jgi:hypothetical protein
MRNPLREVQALACCTFLLVVILNLGPVRLALPWHDVRGISEYISQAQQEGRPVAHEGNYEGQYHFYGRLRKPLQEIDSDGLEGWAAENRSGLVITYCREWERAKSATSSYSQPFRGRQAVVWSSDAILTSVDDR